jgi:hypothetical protein
MLNIEIETLEINSLLILMNHYLKYNFYIVTISFRFLMTLKSRTIV